MQVVSMLHMNSLQYTTLESTVIWINHKYSLIND